MSNVVEEPPVEAAPSVFEAATATENVEDTGLGEDASTDSKVNNDPYAYLDRAFSSENFKIEIKNLPKYYGINELRKHLNEKLKLNASKLKTPKRKSPFVFVCFRNEEDREKAIEVLSGYKWKGKELQVLKAKPSADPLVKKRKDIEDSENLPDSKKLKIEDNLTQEERLKNAIVPLSNLPYEEQLKTKQEELKKVLKSIGMSISYSNPAIKEWIISQQSKYDGLPCELLDMRFSEQNEGYRNKCEFTIGIDEETGAKVVGFRVGSYASGHTGAAPPDNLVHIPDSMKKCAKLFQDFVQSSKLEVFDREVHTGHFKQLTLRVAKDQMMAIVGIHPQNLTESELKEFKDELIKYFSEGPGKEANVTSLYYHAITKRVWGEDTVPPEHLWGDTHIYETVLDLKFRVSPEAFFQTNTSAAEVLYKTAIEMADVTTSSTVLDVCCGTGTIGLCFSKKCHQVLGLEVVPQAIEDAKENATLNNITNCGFFAGKAEDILGSACYRSTTNDLIAVVDPPRAGLHKKAVAHLRKVSKIRKLVYISCKPRAAFKNFIDLCRPESKTLSGEPFVPVKAVAVDMFPHTYHCELIICFERFDVVSKSGPTSVDQKPSV